MEIIYIEGDNLAFKAFIHGLGDKAELLGIDGHFRWVVTREDGTKYIARPIEIKPDEKND